MVVQALWGGGGKWHDNAARSNERVPTCPVVLLQRSVTPS